MPRITGHVRVESRSTGRVWVAKYMQASGAPTRRVLGPSWVKDSGRRTERGAVIWRAASGAPPDGHLTPKLAEDRLLDLLALERTRPRPGRAVAVMGRSFSDACDAYLEYVEFDVAIAVTTLRRYEGIIRRHLTVEFGANLALGKLTADRIDRYRSKMIKNGDLSRSSMRHHLMVLNGILNRARRRGWIAHNPMADVDRVKMPRDSGDFNILEPAQVEAVARAAETDWQPVEPGDRAHTRISAERAAVLDAMRDRLAKLYAEIIRFAACTGLRAGELRALRWRDINERDAIIHVRENSPTSAPASAKVKAPKSERVRSVPLSDPARGCVERVRERSPFTSHSDYVFASPSGVMIDGGDVRDAFYSALSTVGLGYMREKPRPMTFHDLRHTFGTLAVRVFPLTDVQAYMGHADVATTMRYVHHVPRHDAAERLSAAFAIGRPALRLEVVGAVFGR